MGTREDEHANMSMLRRTCHKRVTQHTFRESSLRVKNLVTYPGEHLIGKPVGLHEVMQRRVHPKCDNDFVVFQVRFTDHVSTGKTME